jgi:uncharacterized secreted protein with C-terminal beta-propeller domain
MNEKIVYVVLMFAVAGAVLGNPYISYPWENNPKGNSTVQVQDPVRKFNSPEEIKSFLEKNMENRGRQNYFGAAVDMAIAPMLQTKMITMAPMRAVAESSTVAGGEPSPGMRADDFSTTNIQVAGVDEADIVKNDGKYIYVVSKNKIFIVDAYPPEDAEILSTIEIKGQIHELYINGDRLVVLGNDYGYIEYQEPPREARPSMVAPDKVEIYPGRMSSQLAVAHVYDVSDRSNPELVKEVTVDGNYFDSRMIGDHVYVIATQYNLYYGDAIAMPEVVTTSLGATRAERLDVYYFDAPDYSYSFTNIISVDTQDAGQDVEGKTYLLGSTQNMFVSQDNIYITYQRWLPEPYLYEKVIDAVIEPIVPKSVSAEIESIRGSNKTVWEKERDLEKVLTEYIDALSNPERAQFEKSAQQRMTSVEREIAKEMEKTVVHRIAIEDGDIEYEASGEVPGHVLNQFSMDEYQGYFRIATTTGHVSGGGAQISVSHIYVLDDGLEIVGAVEDLAPGERIYSARFMGKRAYLVTFQKVDPLFVIDLSNPKKPEVLGKLKIPGYSDYLHPYDENHIIGLGKDTVEAENGNFAWYQGIKLALFDVSDVEKPKEISKVIIGDRGTDSYALHDHKAFLFSRDRNLLVIPVLLAEIDYEKYPEELPKWTHGDYVWQGAYVFNIDDENGFKLRGRISHNERTDDFIKSGRFYLGSEYSVKRSLYMDDALYTLSDGMIKMNGLEDLYEINKIYLK